MLGHRFRFRGEGAVMRWECERGCGTQGAKAYESAALAQRYATAFDHEDRDELGRRAPWFGLFPLRMWHKYRNRAQRAA